ncbi:MAG: anaerobic ribonucleoside-triphosphate reductase activating protein [Demequinaceae bacterium]|nr:anaerobic ribonucleoside-triphosphate reductase activating protein [Demequinaceae bacterium]
MSASDLVIAGFLPFSAIDWPGKLSSVLFLQGCPWDCGYCQNPDLIDMRAPGLIPWEQVRATLEQRVGLLDGVVFSGGEPTRQPEIVDAVVEVRELGFGAVLHTNGAYPARFKELLPGLAWVGLDIKAPPARYQEVTGARAGGERAWASLDLLVASGVDYEVRITVDPTVLTLADVEEIVTELSRRGARPPVLQEARSEGVRPDYAERLGNLRLVDVIPADALPGLERRVTLPPSEAEPGIREALTRRESTEF